ncbi:hypothetical protein AC579_2861 [Pseudocercospora musae]|uniref:Uncharacterized protein n=1 Tax=Pseudocercospora musae TaxID=113226 RepID=A0A139I407_9PEZI|nr:hypothetical protein AC579_2861 [Pseudocercospora musae]
MAFNKLKCQTICSGSTRDYTVSMRCRISVASQYQEKVERHLRYRRIPDNATNIDFAAAPTAHLTSSTVRDVIGIFGSSGRNPALLPWQYSGEEQIAPSQLHHNDPGPVSRAHAFRRKHDWAQTTRNGSPADQSESEIDPTLRSLWLRGLGPRPHQPQNARQKEPPAPHQQNPARELRRKKKMNTVSIVLNGKTASYIRSLPEKERSTIRSPPALSPSPLASTRQPHFSFMRTLTDMSMTSSLPPSPSLRPKSRPHARKSSYSPGWYTPNEYNFTLDDFARKLNTRSKKFEVWAGRCAQNVVMALFSPTPIVLFLFNPIALIVWLGLGWWWFAG